MARLLRARHSQEARKNDRVKRELAMMIFDEPVSTGGATAGGDERKLRGIPAIGRGVSGAVAGSSPHLLYPEVPSRVWRDLVGD